MPGGTAKSPALTRSSTEGSPQHCSSPSSCCCCTFSARLIATAKFRASTAAPFEKRKPFFIVNVYVLPLRNPFVVAKAVATAAVLSGNRVSLGIGMGWCEEEFDLSATRAVVVGNEPARRADHLVDDRLARDTVRFRDGGDRLREILRQSWGRGDHLHGTKVPPRIHCLLGYTTLDTHCNDP